MKLGFVGLGKMGHNMVRRILDDGHEVVAYDLNEEAINSVKEYGADGAEDFKDILSQLPERKIVWLMLPSGKITSEAVDVFIDKLNEGDIIIDGGNSFYKDSVSRSQKASKKGIMMLDVGTSGGIWGFKEGFCMMIGGDQSAFEYVEPILQTLAPIDGYQYMGTNGSGHYVKMVHNGIEYGMMQAYAEGFEMMKTKADFDLDLHKICKVWNRGSVVRSWLLELSEDIFDGNQSLSDVADFVEDSGEGRWTVAEAIEENVPAPVITLSLLERIRSRQEESYKAKYLASLRNAFGGHNIKEK